MNYSLNKNNYINSIKKITPLDKKEQEDIADAISFVKQNDKLWKPGNIEKHLCAISVILSKDRKKTFLIDHIKANTWLPPGGHVEKEETFLGTIKKELQEELGIASNFIDKNPFFLTQTRAHDKYGIHTDITAWFLLEGDENIQYKVLEKEVFGGKWFCIKEVLANTSLAFISRAFQKINEMLA